MPRRGGVVSSLSKVWGSAGGNLSPHFVVPGTNGYGILRQNMDLVLIDKYVISIDFNRNLIISGFNR